MHDLDRLADDRAVTHELRRDLFGVKERHEGLVVVCDEAERSARVGLMGGRLFGRRILGGDPGRVLDDERDVAEIEHDRQPVQLHVGGAEAGLPVVGVRPQGAVPCGSALGR